MPAVKHAIVIGAIVAAVLGALALRVVVEGRAALAAGDAALAGDRPGEAIRAYETAARWYLPLAPHVGDAYGKLRALAASEDPAVALAAWRAIRGAARATQTLWTPHADDLAAADEAIAIRAAAVPGAGTPHASWHRERLARDTRPSTGAAVLAALGILAALGGTLVLVRRGMTPAGSLARRPALASGTVILLGVACWAVGLYNA